MLLFAIYLVLFFFSVAQIRVLVVIGLYFIQRRRKRNLSNPSLPQSDIVWPSVVVQLPVYREHKVLDRLLSSIVQMEYPKGLMSVQVIDDSEEHEANLAREIVERYREGTVSVEYLHRTHRTGYKAGALNYGNQQTKCDLVAIFDADFIPRPDFLLKTVPLFQNEKLCAVQTRWSHLNDLESPLTMLQAAVLDSFFCFENPIRQSMGESGLFIGTSGVWRKSAIDDIGGWREGLLGEDVDLSYRAQTSGWYIAYLDEPLSSSELPNTYLVYKSQQRRWARGMSQAYLDHWQQAFKLQRGIGIRFLELSMLYLQLSMPCLLLLALLTGLYIGLWLPRSPLWLAAQVFLLVVLVLFPPIIELLLTQKLLYRDWQRRCILVLRAVPPGIGVSLTILAGYLDTIGHSKTEFVRTPKQSSDTVIQSSKRQWIKSSAQIAALEILVGILTLIAFILAVIRGYIESWFLLLSLSGGFLIAGCTSWWELSQNLIRRAER